MKLETKSEKLGDIETQVNKVRVYSDAIITLDQDEAMGPNRNQYRDLGENIHSTCGKIEGIIEDILRAGREAAV